MKETNTIEAKPQGQKPQLPDLEQTKKFVEQDLHAAHFMIGIVLNTKSIREAVVEEMAKHIYEFNRIGSPIDKETPK